MIAKSGLYYPYIHFRDDAWVKLATLYWPSMARMVPSSYPTADSPTVERLKSELGFVVDLQPGASAERTARLFLRLLQNHGPALVERLGVGYPTRDDQGWFWQGSDGRTGRIGFIYAEKLTDELIAAMADLGLAMTRPGSAHAVDRPSMMHGDAAWIGMDESLAAVYMSVLADDVATAHWVAPCTDQPGFVSAIGGWSMETVARLLLGPTWTADTASVAPAASRESIAYMAIDMAVPREIRDVPVDRVIQFRLKHGDELAAFRQVVEVVVGELPQLGTEISPQIIDSYVRAAVSDKLDKPRRDLEKALKSSKLDTALRSIGVQVALPGLSAAGSAGIGVNPIVGGAIGAAVGFATVARERSKHKATLRAQSPAANYLIEVDRSLTSSTLVRRLIGA